MKLIIHYEAEYDERTWAKMIECARLFEKAKRKNATQYWWGPYAFYVNRNKDSITVRVV